MSLVWWPETHPVSHDTRLRQQAVPPALGAGAGAHVGDVWAAARLTCVTVCSERSWEVGGCHGLTTLMPPSPQGRHWVPVRPHPQEPSWSLGFPGGCAPRQGGGSALSSRPCPCQERQTGVGHRSQHPHSASEAALQQGATKRPVSQHLGGMGTQPAVRTHCMRKEHTSQMSVLWRKTLLSKCSLVQPDLLLSE